MLDLYLQYISLTRNVYNPYSHTIVSHFKGNSLRFWFVNTQVGK